MANEAENDPKKNRNPTPLVRKRLVKLFEAGTKQASQEKPDKLDYAIDLFADCVRGDPGNLVYLQSFMNALLRKFSGAKKGLSVPSFMSGGGRGPLKKALAQSDWDEVIQQGIEVLLKNPRDAVTLTAMGTACGAIMKEMGASANVTFGDCELYYLKCAIDTYPKDKPDPEVCILLAEALTKRERYPEAIRFWHEVELLRPDDELPKKSIAVLTVLQHQAKDPKYADTNKASTSGGGKKEEFTHEDRLQQRIERNPKDLAAYDELANLYINTDRFPQAEAVLRKKLDATNNDPTVREEIEDVQLKALRTKMIVGGNKAKESGNEADKKEFERQKMTLIEKELEVYRNRCERYPNNLLFHYELALRHQMKGDIGEAIKEYQVAKADPRKRGMCLINLGACFRGIKQYQLAMRHYEEAVVEIPDREQEAKKEAYRQAGKLAMALKDLAKADKYLSTLASMDYTYKDISELLARLHKMKEEEGKKGGGADKHEDRKKKQSEPDDEEVAT
jgi:tetratricopeptide (TPR) repeat protein